MTVDSAYFSETYLADPGLEYPFSFESIGEDAIDVYVISSAGVYSLLSPSAYTLTFGYRSPIFSRGKVVLDTKLSAGEQLHIERKTPITNDQVIPSNEDFPSAVVEFALDKLTFILQEIEDHKCDCRGVPEDGVCAAYACDALDYWGFLEGLSTFPMNDPTFSNIVPASFASTSGSEDLNVKSGYVGLAYGGFIDKWAVTGAEPDFCPSGESQDFFVLLDAVGGFEEWLYLTDSGFRDVMVISGIAIGDMESQVANLNSRWDFAGGPVFRNPRITLRTSASGNTTVDFVGDTLQSSTVLQFDTSEPYVFRVEVTVEKVPGTGGGDEVLMTGSVYVAGQSFSWSEQPNISPNTLTRGVASGDDYKVHRLGNVILLSSYVGDVDSAELEIALERNFNTYEPPTSGCPTN